MKLPKKSQLSKENILSIIDEYDILRMYWPADKKLELNKAIISPFRREKQKSFIVGTKYGSITYKDMGDSHFRGDIWSFVSQITQIHNFYDVLLDIDNRFNLGLSGGTLPKEKPSAITWEKPNIEIQKPILIQASVTNKSEIGEEYLKSYHLTLKDLNIFKDTKVSFAKELYINKIRQTIEPFALIYNLKNERGNWIKAYRPLSDKSIKWRTNIPFTEMHGIDEIRDIQTTIVCKSIKDAGTINKFTGLKTTVIQAEDIAAITDENLNKLRQIKNLYICTDIDKKGLDTSWSLTKLLQCKHVNVPYWALEKNCTDFSDMSKEYGYQSVIEHFKTKGII